MMLVTSGGLVTWGKQFVEDGETCVWGRTGSIHILITGRNAAGDAGWRVQRWVGDPLNVDSVSIECPILSFGPQSLASVRAELEDDLQWALQQMPGGE